MSRSFILLVLAVVLVCCKQQTNTTFHPATTDTLKKDNDGVYERVQTGNTQPAELLAFAQTLKGVPYKYASTDPKEGLDCSGFVTYVFNHFNIEVPRTSADFATVPDEIELKQAKPGDLIFFTGTDSTSKTVGHMGIITFHSQDSTLFIHSTSGRAMGVTETPLTKGYQSRYVKTVRIFPQNKR